METSNGYPAWVYQAVRIRRWALWAPMISVWLWGGAFIIVVSYLAGVPQDLFFELALPLFGIVGIAIAWLSISTTFEMFTFESTYGEGEQKAAEENERFRAFLKPSFVLFAPFRINPLKRWSV